MSAYRRNEAKYRQLALDEKERFKRQLPIKTPYKAIGLAIFLFFMGTLLITLGSLLLAGYIIPPEYSDRTWPLLILGSLMFIPGAYHTRIAYYAYQGYTGYSYTDIPEMD